MNSLSSQMKINNNFDNLKSDYFLHILFDYIKKNKSLEIIKINKKLQNRINIDINSYKEYSQLFSSIEIISKVFI